MVKLEKDEYQLRYKSTVLDIGDTLMGCLDNYICAKHMYKIESFDVVTGEITLSYDGEVSQHRLDLYKNGELYIIPYDIRNDLQAMVNLWLS